MIVAAVFFGLVIAYFYLRRLADNQRRMRTEPRVVPLPAKHRPVDFTPSVASLQLSHQPIRDDLKRISGIGPKLEQLLNANGIVSFRQIAEWHEADIEAVDKLLPAFHGRIRREDWVGQARRLRRENGTANA